MITIYQLITSIHLGGSENVAFQLTEHCKSNINNNNFKFTVVELYNTENNYAHEKKRILAEKNIDMITLFKGKKRVSMFFAPLKLFYLLWKNKPKIVHSHTDLPDFVLASSMRILSFLNIKKPAVVRTIHSTQLWSVHPKFAKFTESTFHDDHIASVSLGALNAHKKLRIDCKQPISPNQKVIYNGCKIPEMKKHPFKTSNKKINIAFCGRFVLYKGIDTLINVINKINKLHQDIFVFHIIGNGDYLNDILELQKKYDNVYVYDSVPNISEKLYDFDFIFMPSHFEGLPLVSIESSFAKVPVIASYAPGLDETFPTDWPLRFKLDNENDILKLFENIKNNHYDIDELKLKAYNFVSVHFSFDRMIKEYSNFYLDIYNNEK